MNLIPPERKRSLCASSTDASLTFSLQVLLLRHEEYTVHAEKERQDLHTTITELQSTNSDLLSQSANLRVENTTLKEKMESLEEAVLEGEKRNERMKGMLGEAEKEVERLRSFVKRTEVLEALLQQLERKQETLNGLVEGVERKKGGARQRNMTGPQSKLMVLEEETTVEPLSIIQENHVQDDLVETAVNVFGTESTFESKEAPHLPPEASPVLSNFVSGLLQDNATLQLAMSKQAETLSRLQDEVERLRELLSCPPFPQHQPRSSMDMNTSMRRTSIASERVLGGAGIGLGLDELPLISRKLQKPREVHVHHHYHGAPAIQPQTTLLGRSKSQSSAAHPGARRFPVAVPPPRSTSTITRQPPLQPQRAPLQPISNNTVSNRLPSLPSTPLTTIRAQPPKQLPQTRIRIPASNRYSTSSSRTGGPSCPMSSSNPSSPWSAVFERSEIDGNEDVEEEFSRPTSRGSSVVWAPQGGREVECEDKENFRCESGGKRQEMCDGDGFPAVRRHGFEPGQLHRSPSLLSISGMDIHTSFPAPFSPSSASSTPSFAPSSFVTRNRLPSPSAAIPLPAISTTTAVATLSKPARSNHEPTVTPSNFQPTANHNDAKTKPTPPAAQSRTLLNRSTSLPIPNPNPQEKEHSVKQPLERVEEKPYAPLVDTFGKRVGGWLTSKLGGSGDGDGAGAGAGGAAGSGIGSRSRHNKPLPPTRRAVSDFAAARETRYPSVINNIPSTKRTTSSSTTTTTTSLSSTSRTSSKTKEKEQEQEDEEENKRRLMRSAGMDPATGLPALRQVSGVGVPRLLGGVDEEALRECLEFGAEEGEG